MYFFWGIDQELWLSFTEDEVDLLIIFLVKIICDDDISRGVLFIKHVVKFFVNWYWQRWEELSNFVCLRHCCVLVVSYPSHWNHNIVDSFDELQFTNFKDKVWVPFLTFTYELHELFFKEIKDHTPDQGNI